MARERTYLDYNASAPLVPQARQAMLSALQFDGNPSSVHGEGRRLRALIESARDEVAALVGARPADVVFTSGATEANAAVLARGWDTIVLPAIEHDSVLAPARASGSRLVDIPVGHDGVIDLTAFEALIARLDTKGRTLVALQLANNETGAIQPVAEAAAIAKAAGCAVHTDAVQAAGRIALDIAALGVDTLSLSAHKLGGPKGIGALVMRDTVKLQPLIAGGGQERRRRAGTENVSGIAGFAAAAAVARQRLDEAPRLATLRDHLETAVLETTPDAVIFARHAPRLPNTTCLALPGAMADILVIKLDLAGFAVSAGSACSSGKVAISHVLTAMGAEPAIARGAIRVSIGQDTSAAALHDFVAAWQRINPVLAPRSSAVSDARTRSSPLGAPAAAPAIASGDR